MTTWSEEDRPSLGDIARITITDTPNAQALADQIRASVSRAVEAPLQVTDDTAPVSIPTSPHAQLVHPDTALQLPKTPDRVEAPEGSMGFLPLVHGTTGIREWNPISRRLLDTDVSANAYLLVPEYDNLKPLVLYGIDPKIRVRMTQTEQMKQDFEAVKHLEGLLDQNGWQMVRGFSYFQKQPRKMGEKKEPEQYGTLLLVKHIDLLWELPPRETPYPLDFPKRLERGEEYLPASSITFKHTQRYYEVQFLPRSSKDRAPGVSWVSENALSSDFMVFRGLHEGMWGEWIVRRMKFSDEPYPVSVERYLLKRFEAELDIQRKRIIAPADAIAHIIGKPDEFNRRHIDRITDAISVARLDVMTKDEAERADYARKLRHKSHAHGEEAHDRARVNKDEPLVRTYRMVNDEQRDRWERKGYAVFVGVDDYWVVKVTPEAIAQYLNERFGARLEIDKASIVIDGDKKDLVKQMFGKKHAHRLALKALLKDYIGDQDLRIVKTFRKPSEMP